MWEEIETGILFWNAVKAIETDLDNQESLDCILDTEDRKQARFFIYSGDYDIGLLIYENITFGHKLIKLATSNTYSVSDICGDIIDKIREVID